MRARQIEAQRQVLRALMDDDARRSALPPRRRGRPSMADLVTRVEHMLTPKPRSLALVRIAQVIEEARAAQNALAMQPELNRDARAMEAPAGQTEAANRGRGERETAEEAEAAVIREVLHRSEQIKAAGRCVWDRPVHRPSMRWESKL
jgi:hypothetical protein